MNRYSSAICSRYNLIMSTTVICSNRLKSKMAAFLAIFQISSFSRSFISKGTSKQNCILHKQHTTFNLPTYERGHVSDVYSSFSDKNGLTMTMGRGSQVSDRIFKERLKDILVGGIQRGLLVTTVKRKHK